MTDSQRHTIHKVYQLSKIGVNSRVTNNMIGINNNSLKVLIKNKFVKIDSKTHFGFYYISLTEKGINYINENDSTK